jgi:uncharacterized membrane protein YheB (UPF0754 family)
MSDDEIRKKLNRARLEKEYESVFNQVSQNKINSSETEKKASLGKRFMKKVYKDVLIPSATNAAKTVVQNYLTNFGNDLVNTKKSVPKKTKIDNIDINKLTDAELQDVISRINNVNSYNNYAKSSKKKK